MILAAGLGSRMRPLTDRCPKPLLRAGGRPLIDYHLEKLAAAGVAEVVVNSAWLSEQLVEYLGDGHQYGLQIHHSVEREPLETAGGIIQALPVLGAEPFLLVNGDIWTDLDFAPLLARRPEGAHLLLTANPSHHPRGDFSLEGSRLVPPVPGAALTYMGVSVWHPRVFAGLAPGRRALKSIIDAQIAEQRASGEIFTGRWWDIGTPQRLSELDTLLRG